MDLSDFTRCLPSDVAAVALERSRGDDFEIFVDEERLLPERVAPGRRADFRLGRHAAHLALRELGFEPRPILRGDRGEPLWPDGVVGSITHSHGHAIAVAAPAEIAGRIGIDLEDRTRYFDALESQIAVPAELAHLAELDTSIREAAVIELFSAKESIYKAHFPRVRRFFGFHAAKVELAPGHLVAYFTDEIDPLYPIDRPMEIGRRWVEGAVLTWLLLPPD